MIILPCFRNPTGALLPKGKLGVNKAGWGEGRGQAERGGRGHRTCLGEAWDGVGDGAEEREANVEVNSFTAVVSLKNDQQQCEI